MNTRRVLLLIVLFVVWYTLSATPVPEPVLIAAALIGPPGMFAAGLLGRRALDRQPEPDNARRVTAAVHDAVLAFFGTGVIAAVREFRIRPLWQIPGSETVGLVLLIVSGLLLIAATGNLILSGLGIPIAVLQTRRLASNWLYAWTRNPIVLSGLLVLFSLGLWLQSGGLIAWTLLLVVPIVVFVLRIFEERELEIRFGDSYREYRARVPMLIPKPPSRQAEQAADLSERM